MIFKVGSEVPMIICICANVSDRKLRAVVADGAATMRAVERRCGAGAGCGACRALVRECLRESRETRAQVTQVMMELAVSETPVLAPA